MTKYKLTVVLKYSGEPCRFNGKALAHCPQSTKKYFIDIEHQLEDDLLRGREPLFQNGGDSDSQDFLDSVTMQAPEF